MTAAVDRRTALVAAVSAALAGCTATPDAPRPAGEFDAWSEAFAAEFVRMLPQLATRRRYFSGAEQAGLDRQLDPQDRGPATRLAPLLRRGLADLARFDADTLTPDQRGAAETLGWSLRTRLAMAPYEDHPFPLNQFGGVQVDLPDFLADEHPLNVPDDVDSWLARLGMLGARLDDARGRADAAARRGLRPPRFIAERARAQVVARLAVAPADDRMHTRLAAATERMPGLSAAARVAALRQAEQTIAGRVRPAYERLRVWFDALLPTTDDAAGLWRLPDGAAAYAAALANYTTTSLTAGEIHAIGRRDVARIEAEMDRVLRDLGRRDGSVAERMRALGEAAQPPAEPDPRPALLARYTAYVRDAERRAAALFRRIPKAPVEVRRVPPLTEATAAASYQSPAPDGSRPGIFWTPLPGPTYDVLRMYATAVHETVPGHHYQMALLLESPRLRRWQQRTIFSGGPASWEGWALYAEQLAIEQGWYDGDPQALLGALDMQLFRARRLVVDTGLHAFRWTRRQAIDYGISAAEVERYVVLPGQACAYRVGLLRLLALRDEARAALGARFVLPDFHEAILQAGAVPLDVLAGAVRRWIARTAA